MTDGSLDLTGKIDQPIVEIFESVNKTCLELELLYIVVGATARDLVMHHGYGAEIVRATKDVDLAINIPGWDAFGRLKDNLLASGFGETSSPHRLVSPSKISIDLIPFGGVAEDGAIIKWPPDRTTAMNILGFREAYDHAIQVRLGPPSNLTVSVASPCGLALLKIIAWTNRDPHVRSKDARDLAYLLRTHEEIHSVSDRVYSDGELLEKYGWDAALAAACLLGQDTGQIACRESRKLIERFFTIEQLPSTSETLVYEMGGNAKIDRNTEFWTAFLDGFVNSRGYQTG